MGQKNLSLGNDTIVCIGDHLVLSLDIPLNCNAAYTWQDGSHGDDFLVQMSGTYWVAVESECFIIKDTIEVEVIDCHPGCTQTMTHSGLYGRPGCNVIGKSLVVSPDESLVYAAGTIDDSIFISALDLQGQIIWTQTINLLSGDHHSVSSLIVDSEGFLILAGNTNLALHDGSTYIIRFDLYLMRIVWSTVYYPLPLTYKCLSVIELGPGGNFLMANTNGTIEIDRESGQINDIVSPLKNARFYEMHYRDGYVYGVGPYYMAPEKFERFALSKFDVSDGSLVWMKSGDPLPGTTSQYGPHLDMVDEYIYSVFTDRKDSLYIQKTSMAGDRVWLKNYCFPASQIIANEIIHVNDGLIVYAINYNTQEYLFFKINFSGEIVWSKAYYGFTDFIQGLADGATHQVIPVQNQLFFIGSSHFSNDPWFTTTIGRFTPNGKLLSSCLTQRPLIIEVKETGDHVTMEVTPSKLNFNPMPVPIADQMFSSVLFHFAACPKSDTIYQYVSVPLCEGQIYEGYSVQGTYVDTFKTQTGCDSIRTLVLTDGNRRMTIDTSVCPGFFVEGYDQEGTFQDTFQTITGCDSIRILNISLKDCRAIVQYDLELCRSFMQDGSNMDYFEFVPIYPDELECATVSASFLTRIGPTQNKHSCTNGIGDSIAMCINAIPECTFITDHPAALIFEVVLTPTQGSQAKIDELRFFEKAPENYSWIQGPMGLNNYPAFFAIRVQADNIEIYRKEHIATSLQWTQHWIDFGGNKNFTFYDTTTIRFELLPYCPVGNGAEVSVWDIDEIRVVGTCDTLKPSFLMGKIKTRTGYIISDVQVTASSQQDFHDFVSASSENGVYILNLLPGEPYYIKGYKNDDLLRGVTTLDLVTLQMHLLGLRKFQSLDQFVAADIDLNGRINVLDLLELRRMILNHYTELPGNTSWRFGSYDQNWLSADISQFVEIAGTEYLPDSGQALHLIGIKIGDVNSDVK